MRRERREQAHGPYRRGRKWRVVETSAAGARSTVSFESETEALEYIAKFNDEAEGRTLSGVIDEYLKHRRTQDLAEGTIKTDGYRLHAMLRDVERDRLLSSVTPAIARNLYEQRIVETKADTHIGELCTVAAMFSWCVKRGWLRSNPWLEVEAQGKKTVRRSKLRIDEARAFLVTALAEKTDAGLAAAMALLMGLRATELVTRVVRDVDDGCRVLWVDEDGGAELKTESSERHLEIPSTVRARVAALIKGREPNVRLFPDVDRHWLHYHVVRLCTAAGVPRVTPHGLRRSWSQIGAEVVSIEHVARALGHSNTKVTRRHYVGRGGADQRQASGTVLRVISGGRR
jgi:integrase